jgi:phage shock protein PspC (stress-responsive transcriptional regulator)
MFGTILTILSFPFWLLSFMFVVTGVFGTIKINGVPYYGNSSALIRFGVVSIGVFFGAIAYVMVAI